MDPPESLFDGRLDQPRLGSPRVAARDEEEARRLAFLQGWTDGLPIVVPTPGRVLEMLDGRDPTRVVATLPEQGAELTNEQVAVNAVMAGCEPADLPLLLAIVSGLGVEAFNLHSTTVSGATAPLAIVSGPATTTFRINTGPSLFGPGPTADVVVGRAVRLVLLNACGGVPGVVDKSTFGHPGKFGYCIGETSEHLPTGWLTLHRERDTDADSGVTVISCDAPIAVRNDWSTDVRELLRAVADVMSGHHTGGCYVVVLGPRHAAAVDAAGWTRRNVAEFLHTNSARPLAELVRRGRVHPATNAPDGSDVLHAVEDPDDILLTVAGGHLYGYSAVLPPWVGGRESRPVTVPLPHPTDNRTPDDN